jgi:hypothetical protein
VDPIGTELTAIVIFLFTFALIVTGGRARSVAGLLGGFLMINARIFSSIEEVISYVNLETVVVLFWNNGISGRIERGAIL